MFKVDRPECNDFEAGRSMEWLITNGLGGYASSTVCGMNSRRYHGLLVAASQPPVARLVMLSKLEDAVVTGGERSHLATNMYGEDVIHPHGYRNLTQFRLDPFPVYVFSTEKFVLEKSIIMPKGQNTVAIEYVFTPLVEFEECRLEVSPLIAFRDYHASTHENAILNSAVVGSEGSVQLKPYGDLPSLFLAHNADEVVTAGYWYRNFEYPEEKARGLEHLEDLFNPVTFRFNVSSSRQSRFVLIASTEPRSISDAAEYRASELRHEVRSDDTSGPLADVIRSLERAAEHFIVARAPFKSVIAGYHWFGDWGRDTMIALPGLLLSTGQPETAKEILLQFTRYVHGGMLPNRFPDHGEEPEYNTVDATLWCVECIRQYLKYREDEGLEEAALELIERSFYPTLKSIINHHLVGTRYGIHADAEGFLWAGDESTQLTWMDAKVGDVAITPRAGRPVEIQGLWYNALRIVEDLGRRFADTVFADYCAGVASRLRANFERVFWSDDHQYLYDVVGESSADASLRPNQVIAISLHYGLLDEEKVEAVLRTAERHLLTPFGLRTLAPSDPKYRGQYRGDVWSRDSAYHQGTVWPWLAGPFFITLIRKAGDKQQALAKAREWLEGFASHFETAGIGQVSEVFDAEEPHHPGGCIAQAWSVAELLRLAKMVSSQTEANASAEAQSEQIAIAAD